MSENSIKMCDPVSEDALIYQATCLKNPLRFTVYRGALRHIHSNITRHDWKIH